MKPSEILKLYPYAIDIKRGPNDEPILIISNGWIRLRNIKVIWEN